MSNVVRNPAAEELQRLTQQSQEPLRRAKQVESVRDTRGQSSIDLSAVRNKEKASFAFPEALVTAAGASAILGPVGILLGVGQGILGKRAEQNALDQFSAQSEAMAGVDEILNSEFDRLAANAGADDIEQIQRLQTQKDIAVKLATSASPQQQALGGELLKDLQTKMNDYAVLQETQKINEEATRAQLEREMTKDQIAAYDRMIPRYEQQSQAYKSLVNASNVALRALEDGSPAQLSGAITLLAKTLDPVGVVRPEDEKKWARLGGWGQQLLDLAESAVSGGSTATTRNNMAELIDNIRQEATAIQSATEASFINEAIDKELPTKYYDNFTTIDKLGLEDYKPVPEDQPGTVEGAQQSVRDNTSMAINDTIETAQNFITRGIEADRARMTDFFEWAFGTPYDEDIRQQEEEAAKRDRIRPVGGVRLPTN